MGAKFQTVTLGSWMIVSFGSETEVIIPSSEIIYWLFSEPAFMDWSAFPMSFNFDVPSTVITLASSSKLATRRMDVDGEDWMVILKKSVKHNGLPEGLI